VNCEYAALFSVGLFVAPSDHRHRIHRPSKRPKIIEVVYQQLTQLGHTDSAVGKPLIYYCENSSSYSGRGAWSIYSMSMPQTD